MALNFEKVNYTDGQTIIGAKNLNDIQDAILQIDPIIERIEALEYEPVEIVKFEAKAYKTNPESPLNPTALGNPVLLGNVADRLDFSYTLSKIASATVAGEARGKAISGSFSKLDQTVSSTATYTMTATDDGSPRHSPHTAVGSYRIVFANLIFWGAAAVPSTVDGAFLQGLSKSAISDTKGRTVTVNAGAGQYIWYALPKRLGAVSFKVGGFDGGFEAAQECSVTNAAGFTENYYVYRSSNPSLGNTTVVIS